MAWPQGSIVVAIRTGIPENPAWLRDRKVTRARHQDYIHKDIIGRNSSDLVAQDIWYAAYAAKILLMHAVA
ncbi:hypothetical protein ACRALDRAFT_208331 [Sodiomyces alcalophilus JCM 7366]|uniref:uncharacterized protein n=1 Tax=Sodiomyces alcalophilus JCM 7366 TaxID=591952 RepID=UPI0039B41167